VPVEVERVYLDEKEKRQVEKYVVDTDEGPRASTLEGLAKLKPVFDAKGSVTAGNSSQTSDGAAFVLVVSERMLKQLGVKPIARLLSYHVAGVEPRIMGIGPVAAVPKALEKAGLKLNDIGLFELNEAFASAVAGGGARAGHQPGDRERERRGHRHGASAGVHGHQADGAVVQRDAAAEAEVRSCHDVCGDRAGCCIRV
jgi:acetyl-CoA acyltransferase